MTNADYDTYSGSWSNTGVYDMSITLYDTNENIRNLTRRNSSGSNRESLAYTYAGNQLSSITGIYNGSPVTSKTFLYDSNGNVKTDNLRSLTVQYFDELDLPKRYANTSGTQYVNYEYDAAGTKWSKTAVASGTSTMEYYGTFVYQDGTLDKVLTGEGYYLPSNGKYHYYLKDHLGSTRMVVSYTPMVATVEQVIEYYPFGSMFSENNLDKNEYLYNGKELQNEFFENYDYGARFYDPELGRWHVIDNKAEKYAGSTPYAYALNNPILFLDPDGNEVWKSTSTNNGVKTVTFHFDIRVVNTGNYSKNQISKWSGIVASQIKSSFSGYSKESNIRYRAEVNMDVSGKDLNNQYTMEFTPKVIGGSESAIGRAEKFGNTEVNNIQIEAPGSDNGIYEKSTEDNIGRTGAHEVGHTGDLRHPKDEEKRGIIKGPFYNDNLMYQSRDAQGTDLYGNQLDHFSKNVQSGKPKPKPLSTPSRKQLEDL